MHCTTLRMIRRTLSVFLATGMMTGAMCAQGAAAVDIGRTTTGKLIEALTVEATSKAAPTVVLIGGLAGDPQSARAVRAEVADYALRGRRPIRLLAIPAANPDGAALQFPPTGIAYRENATAQTVWRWLGSQAPDLVLIAGERDFGLTAALGANQVADMGSIAAKAWSGAPDWVARLGSIDRSAARTELERRRQRSPRELAEQLARVYGQDFDQPWYIGAIALVARIQLGQLDAVRKLVEPYADGTKDPLARANSLVLAGQIVFTELAKRTGDARYVAAVRRSADLGFDAGQMREAMPYHDGYSDSVFMGAAIVAQAGSLTGERRYFDMADRHLQFMQKLDLRPDGLYRHRPEADVAWGRGNGFAALGLALVLSEMPPDHPGYARTLQSYRNLMAALLPFQTSDGLWRNVINQPGAFAEYSGTAMIGFALHRGLDRGWLKGRKVQRAVDQAWLAVNSRTSDSGLLIDVCESTAGLTTLDQYLQRAALLGKDPRGGAMALLFATELMGR